MKSAQIRTEHRGISSHALIEIITKGERNNTSFAVLCSGGQFHSFTPLGPTSERGAVGFHIRGEWEAREMLEALAAHYGLMLVTPEERWTEAVVKVTP